jgi:hypothetical protein
MGWEKLGKLEAIGDVAAPYICHVSLTQQVDPIVPPEQQVNKDV